MILWIAYALNVVAILVVYHGLFRLFQLLYRRNPLWAVSLAVFLSPSVYVLSQVQSPLELLWVLLLTPFYSVAVLIMLFTEWMIRYYSMAYIILAVLSYLVQRRTPQRRVAEGRLNYQVFWQRRDIAYGSRAMGETRFQRLGTWVTQSSSWTLNAIGRHWNLVKVTSLVLIAAMTLLVGAEVRLRDPSYQEVMQFVASDKTELNRYSEDRYACARFASDFKSSAATYGYNCGYVVVYFPDGESHALNAFDTKDRGMMFIEPQLDAVVTLNVGQPYWDRARFNAPDYNDTITGYTIDW